ncbi:MAG TPA: Fe2+-dependent dioxygenase [Burkholderiaceae bacterium]|nr:Fe2+-dependent dioxygenase [Burkholderiaceae bacterium]
MMTTLEGVLDADELGRIRALLAAAPWTDGRLTAGDQAARAKRNLQLAEACPQLPALRAIVDAALARNPAFFSATLPRRVHPVLFNRYQGEANAFDWHVDGAVRRLPDAGGWLRTDVSGTLFLSAPDEYDGGELEIEDTFGTHSVKLAAGGLVLYPSSSIHRVRPVTRGARLASFFWLESMVRDAGERRLLHEMDMALLSLRAAHGETDAAIRLTGVYHNLLRRWADA